MGGRRVIEMAEKGLGSPCACPAKRQASPNSGPIPPFPFPSFSSPFPPHGEHHACAACFVFRNGPETENL